MSPHHLTRRAALASATSVAAVLAGCPTDAGAPTSTDSPGSSTGTSATDDGTDRRVGATPVAEGLTAPVGVTTVREDRYLIADQPGRVVLAADGETRTLLDLRDRVVDVSGYDERGLLGLALHPDFESNGRLFVRYSAPNRPGTPSSYDHTFVLEEYAVDPDGLTADPDSDRTILEIPEPQSNHNAGDLAFGPDGLLYVPVGDGGGANDQGTGHVNNDWYGAVEGGNGQDVTENLLGSILRIDVDDEGEDGDGRAYGIPDDNPLVGEDGLDEHYAWGLRNPWRISFGPDGRLFAADVGQNRFEEINVVEAGGNYGWNVREAGACFQAEECPTVTPDGVALQDPIVSYPHRGAPVSGVAVVGGYLYDGEAFPGLRGRYVFGDWQANGRLFHASETESGPWQTATLPLASDAPGEFLLSFGRDADGELLIATSNRPGVVGATGAVHRLVPA